MLHFCIDIDNVIAETDPVMRRLIAEVSGDEVKLEYCDIITFNYHECRDRNGKQISKDEWNRVHSLFSESKQIMSIEPMPGAVQAISRLSEVGTVHLATSRMHKARKSTIDWLDQHGFSPKCDLHFLKHGEKHATLKAFTAAVEDDYDQAVGYALLSRTPCFILRHPWNASRPALPNVTHVNDWEELLPRLLDLAEGGHHGPDFSTTP